MKKITLAAALLGTGVVSAQAADLPVRVARPAPAPVVSVYDWTGFYLGVNVGGGFGRSYTQLSYLGSDVQSRIGGPGVLGGGQIGYNWQANNFLGLANVVFGVEADIQGANLDDNRTCAINCTPGSTGFALRQNLDWFSTVRGRVGLAEGPVLTYFTAGFAYGGVKLGITDLSPGGSGLNNFTANQSGWTIGTGMEAALGGNWTGKVEYIFLNLGAQNGAVFGANPYNFRSEVQEQIFRAGLNYRMGPAGTYVPEPTGRWGGMYVGGNLTAAFSNNLGTLAYAPTGAVEQFNLDSTTSFAFGGQIGYNWQAGSWVYGLETDFQWSAQNDNKPCQLACNPLLSAAKFDQHMDWLGTARGRLGYSLGSTLFYATGGAAYGNVNTKITGFAPGVAFNQRFDNNKVGWTVGGGIESPFKLFGWFGPNWTSKTEYLYVDLGSTTNTIAGTGLSFSNSTREHIFRTGLNYNFGGPIVQRY